MVKFPQKAARSKNPQKINHSSFYCQAIIHNRLHSMLCMLSELSFFQGTKRLASCNQPIFSTENTVRCLLIMDKKCF